MEYQETIRAYRRNLESGWDVLDALLHDAEVSNNGRIVNGELGRIVDALALEGIETNTNKVRDRISAARWAANTSDRNIILFRSRKWSLCLMAQRAHWTQDRLAAHIAANGLFSDVRRDPDLMDEPTIDDEWREFITKMATILTRAAALEERTEEADVVEASVYVSVGRSLYLAIREKKIDVEYRELMAKEDARRDA